MNLFKLSFLAICLLSNIKTKFELNNDFPMDVTLIDTLQYAENKKRNYQKKIFILETITKPLANPLPANEYSVDKMTDNEIDFLLTQMKLREFHNESLKNKNTAQQIKKKNIYIEEQKALLEKQMNYIKQLKNISEVIEFNEKMIYNRNYISVEEENYYKEKDSRGQKENTYFDYLMKHYYQLYLPQFQTGKYYLDMVKGEISSKMFIKKGDWAALNTDVQKTDVKKIAFFKPLESFLNNLFWSKKITEKNKVLKEYENEFFNKMVPDFLKMEETSYTYKIMFWIRRKSQIMFYTDGTSRIEEEILMENKPNKENQDLLLEILNNKNKTNKKNELEAFKKLKVYKIEINDFIQADFEEEFYFFKETLEFDYFLISSTDFKINNEYIQKTDFQKHEDNKSYFVFLLFKTILKTTDANIQNRTLQTEIKKKSIVNQEETMSKLIEFLLLKLSIVSYYTKTSFFTNEQNQRLQSCDDVTKRFVQLFDESLNIMAADLKKISTVQARIDFIKSYMIFTDDEYQRAGKLVETLSTRTNSKYNIKNVLPELMYHVIIEEKTVSPKGNSVSKAQNDLYTNNLGFVKKLRINFYTEYIKRQFESYQSAKYEQTNLLEADQFNYMIKRLVVHGIINPDMEADKDFLIDHKIEFIKEERSKILI